MSSIAQRAQEARERTLKAVDAEYGFMGLARAFGKTFIDRDVTIAEALEETELDFEVVVGECHGHLPDGTQDAMPGWWTLHRKNKDGSYVSFSAVQSRYRVVQNTDAFAFGQSLVDDFDAAVVAAAGWGKPQGVSCFVALRTDRSLIINDTDVHDVYVLISNSHDRSSGVTATVVPVRVDGNIHVTTAMPHAPQMWRMRHSGDIGKKFRDAESVMRMVENWALAYEEVTSELLSHRIDDQTFEAFTKFILPTPESASDSSALEWARRRATLKELWKKQPSSSFGAGTCYAAVMTLNAYVDGHAPARGDAPDLVRAERSLNGEAAKIKAKAWNWLTKIAAD